MVSCAFDSCSVAFKTVGQCCRFILNEHVEHPARGRWGRETVPLTCRGQSDCPLPASSMLLYSERMLGDKFRAPTHPPSATASCKPVSMGTAARLPGVKIGRERVQFIYKYINYLLRIDGLPCKNGSKDSDISLLISFNIIKRCDNKNVENIIRY